MEHVGEIQDLWMKLVGFDPSKIGADGIDNHHPYQLKGTMDALRRAQELDVTNGLFLMRLDAALDEWLAGTSTTGLAHIDDPEPFDAKIATARRLRDLLKRSGMHETRDALRETVVRALEHYGAAEREDIATMLAHKHSIGILWRDALEAMDRSLETHQFLRGDPETEKPLYQENVLGFWSVGDALRLASNMPSGIAIALIRDAHAVHSHFAFVVRNGGNLWIVTDRTDWRHPLQSRMSRRPERHLTDRMERARFPYGLLDIEYFEDEDGDVVGLNVPRQDGIIPAQQRAFRLKPMRDLGPDEVVWTAMMFALLTRRFFVETRQLPELSYTGEMVELPHLIETVADRAGLPMKPSDYKPLKAPEIRASELTTDRVVTDAMIRQSPTRHNEWMLQRYNALVRDDVLAIPAAPSTDDVRLTGTGELERHDTNRHRWDAPEGARIHEVDVSQFGSAERILADRVWIARHNQAAQIAALARHEYERRRLEIETWWRETLERRLPALLEAVRADSLPVETEALFQTHGFRNTPATARNLLVRHALKGGKQDPDAAARGMSVLDWTYGTYRAQILAGEGSRPNHYRCAGSDRPATDVVQITPEVADDLAAIAGLAVTELPDVLQHWRKQPIYIGNHILDRLDPMEFVPKNPWSELPFTVLIYVSRYTYPRTAPLKESTTP